jgi:hypothetical protein
MRTGAIFEIAGITFVVTCDDAVLSQNIPDAYKPFLIKEYPYKENFNINVIASPAYISQNGNLNKIFDSEESWSMFRDEEQYYIGFNSSNISGKIDCRADFSKNTKKANLYCTETQVQTVNGKTEVNNPFCYPLDQILLMYILSEQEGAIFHAAGINLNGKGYIFPGRSGAGKSTLSRQFASTKNAELLSDDRVIVRKTGDLFKIFGTPWPGEEGIAENKDAQLKGIFFISHGTENMAKDMKPVEALKRLMPVTSIPWFDRDVMPKILNFCEELVLNIPAYQLYFKPDTEVVKFLEEFDKT